jgi:hypothetical protein
MNKEKIGSFITKAVSAFTFELHYLGKYGFILGLVGGEVTHSDLAVRLEIAGAGALGIVYCWVAEYLIEQDANEHSFAVNERPYLQKLSSYNPLNRFTKRN